MFVVSLFLFFVFLTECVKYQMLFTALTSRKTTFKNEIAA